MFFICRGDVENELSREKKDKEIKDYLSALWGSSKYEYTIVREGLKMLEFWRL